MTERKTGAQIAAMTGLDLANWLADFDFDGLRRDISKLQAADGATSATFENLGREVEDLRANLGGLRGDVDDLRDAYTKLKAGPDVGDLDEASRARVAALNAARAAVASRSLMGSQTGVDALDVVQVARFILTGQDPWADDAGEKTQEPDQ